MFQLHSATLHFRSCLNLNWCLTAIVPSSQAVAVESSDSEDLDMSEEGVSGEESE